MERQQHLAGNVGGRALAAANPTARHRRLDYAALSRILLVVGAALVVVAPIWSSGTPWGSDTWGHLHRANYMLEMIQTHGLVDGFLKSAWMTDWYLGDPTRVYYPPLTTWLMGGLSALTGDVFLAYRLFVSGVMIALALSVYAVGTRWTRSHRAPVVGAILAVTAPYTLRTIFAEGNLPRALVILTLPWLIWGTDTILTGKSSGSMIILVSLLWLVTLVAHVMQAAMFAVIIGVFVIARVLVNVYIPIRRVPLSLLPVGIGGILAAFYLLPAYGHFELANVPYLPTSKIDLFSINLDALRPAQDGLETLVVGSLSLVTAGVFALISRTENQRAILIAVLAAVFLAFGNASGVYRLVPLYQSMLPERFLNASSIMVPLIIASLPPLTRRRWLGLVLALALVLAFEFRPAWRMVHMRPAPPDDLATAEALAEHPLPGRAISLTLPNPTAPQIYLTSEIGQRDHVSGWALENTPHQDGIRRVIAAMTRSPAYAERVMSLWNTDYALIRPETPYEPAGFEAIFYTPTLNLWERESPSSFIQSLPDERMLVIGQNATSWLFAFPFATEGHTPEPEAYDLAYLDHFNVIGLNRFQGDATVLRNWVERGNTLIADLSGHDPIFNQGYALFGVQAMPVTLVDPVPIKWPDVDFPSMFPGDWIGATYIGLDVTVASIRLHGQDYPLLGYKEIGQGRVWYIGMNLLYWLDITGQGSALNQVVNTVLHGTGVDRSLVLPPLLVKTIERDATSIVFTYDSSKPVDAVLSMTYFPRWSAQIDGQPLALDNHEHLVRLSLPPGEHTVTLDYKPYSLYSMVGAGVSLVSVVVIGLGAVWLKRYPVLAQDDRQDFFFDRHAAHAVPLQTQPAAYTTCPNCGSEKATVGPPTEESYPFVAIECPDCGYRL